MNYNITSNIFFRELFIAIALIIVLDFLLPGKVINEEIVSIKKQRQQYYNAARNHHYSYEVVTNNNRFVVSKKMHN